MDESTKDDVLSQLLGEVDGYTGTKLPGAPKKGVEVSIMITPHGDEPDADDGETEHDPEGLCKGGCDHEDAAPSYGDFLKKMGE